MRSPALIAVSLLAACGAAPENKTAPVAAAPAPGQWELTAEVTRFAKSDQGTPRINTPVGTRATESVCVGPGDQVSSTLFSGAAYTCTYPTYYVRNGRVNMTLNCRREGLSGDIPMNVNGTFEANSIAYTRNLRTSLATDGDVEVDARVTGRRTGDCTPQAPAAGRNKG
jgi:hypothetical protein